MKVLFVLDDSFYGENYACAASFSAPFADMIWYRAKNIPACEILRRAKVLRKLLPAKTLILGARADIAFAAGFDGVHLNSGSLLPETVAEIFPNLIIGYSAHSIDECRMAGVDYFTLSPIFDTPKNYKVNPLGMVPAPAPNVFAMGAVKPCMAGEFEKLGYAGIAGIRFMHCPAVSGRK